MQNWFSTEFMTWVHLTIDHHFMGDVKLKSSDAQKVSAQYYKAYCDQSKSKSSTVYGYKTAFSPPPLVVAQNEHSNPPP